MWYSKIYFNFGYYTIWKVIYGKNYKQKINIFNISLNNPKFLLIFHGGGQRKKNLYWVMVLDRPYLVFHFGSLWWNILAETY